MRMNTIWIEGVMCELYKFTKIFKFHEVYVECFLHIEKACKLLSYLWLLFILFKLAFSTHLCRQLTPS